MNPSSPSFRVNDSGHSYAIANAENGTQPLLFIRKKPAADGSGALITAQDGTTTEAVIEVLIDRLEYLNTLVPSEYNDAALDHLTNALAALEERQSDRQTRGVEGTNAE